jgi:hypothetical protein
MQSFYGRNSISAAFLALMFTLPALGQLEVVAGNRLLLTDASGVQTIGSMVFIESPNIKSVPVGLVKVDTKASNVSVEISDVNRTPGVITKLSDTHWMVDQPGKWWIDVTAIDFKQNIYGKKTVTLEVGTAPAPNPPNPGPGPTPPVPPSPISDTYGVGMVAFSAAPRHAATVQQYASIYYQAGNILFGKPTLKFVVSSNDAHYNDPARSIPAWIKSEQSKIVCPDVATCQQWEQWRIKVNEAFRQSQMKRQFTRDDWYAAFNEVVAALGAVK